jgi:hypothetical protein
MIISSVLYLYSLEPKKGNHEPRTMIATNSSIIPKIDSMISDNEWNDSREYRFEWTANEQNYIPDTFWVTLKLKHNETQLFVLIQMNDIISNGMALVPRFYVNRSHVITFDGYWGGFWVGPQGPGQPPEHINENATKSTQGKISTWEMKLNLTRFVSNEDTKIRFCLQFLEPAGMSAKFSIPPETKDTTNYNTIILAK